MKFGIITNSIKHLKIIINVILTIDNSTNNIEYIITDNEDVLSYCLSHDTLKTILKIFYIK